MTANRKVTARYAEIARFLGLHFNEEFCVAYGEKDGFTLRVSGLDTGRGIEYGMVCISVGVAENGVKFEPDKQFRKEHKGIMGVVQEKHTVRMTLKRYVRVEKIKGILQESLPAFLDMLRMEFETSAVKVSIIKSADPVKRKVYFCYYRLAKGIRGILSYAKEGVRLWFRTKRPAYRQICLKLVA